jgi:GT2 family glycosyltransferase
MQHHCLLPEHDIMATQWRYGRQNMDNRRMNIAVVILNWNQPEAIATCLKAICAWRRLRPEIWVVDNASNPPLELKEPCPLKVHILRSEVNRGFAGGNNMALSAIMQTQADAALLLNSDAKIAEIDAEYLVSTISAEPGIGVAGPCLVEQRASGQSIANYGGRDIARHANTRLARRPTDGLPFFDVDYVPGTVALFSAAMLKATGVFEEEFFFSGEQADLCVRARKAGFRCVTAPGAVAIHEPDTASPLRNTLYPYYTLRNRFLYIRRHSGRRKPLHFLCWTCRGAAMVMLALLQCCFARARAIFWALNDGLKGHFGNRHDRFGC